MVIRFKTDFGHLDSRIYENEKDFLDDCIKEGFSIDKRTNEVFTIIDTDPFLSKGDYVYFDNLRHDDDLYVASIIMYPMQNIKEYFLTGWNPIKLKL